VRNTTWIATAVVTCLTTVWLASPSLAATGPVSMTDLVGGYLNARAMSTAVPLQTAAGLGRYAGDVGAWVVATAASAGTNENGPAAAHRAVVPEPSSILLALAGAVLLRRARHRS
jgi:hypothetical protein